jgi:hypothetical protein
MKPCLFRKFTPARKISDGVLFPRPRQGYFSPPIFLLQMNVRYTYTAIPDAGLGPEVVNRLQRSIQGCGPSVVGRERALRYAPLKLVVRSAITIGRALR